MTRSPLLLAALVSLAAAAPASAAPAPMECRGTAFTDAANDARDAMDQQAEANLELKEGFFRFAEDKLHADLRVANLSTTTEDFPASGLRLAVLFTADGQARYVAAASTAGDPWTFEHGTVAGDGSLVRDTTTTVNGRVFEGTDGIVEIDVPLDLHGKTITGLGARAEILYPSPAAPRTADIASGAGSFEVAVCPPPPPPPEPPAPPEPPPPPPPEPAPFVPPVVIPILPVTPVAPYTVTVPRLRAKLLRKGRTFSVVVDPDQPVTRLTVTLSKGGKVLAKGTRASLAGKATIRVKVAAKRIARGTYKLTFSGRTAAGKAAAGAVAVDVV